MDPLAAISTRHTSQTQPADDRQALNNAGGYTFSLDDDARIRRFLILGSDGPTYYTSAQDLTKDNAGVILNRARADARGLTDLLIELSEAGRAPRQNPTLFALAAATALGDDDGRAYALAALPRIARTGTHLFLFARYVEQFRGWGRGLRSAVARWYTEKPIDQLAYQVVKYRQREGWSHRDLLRLAHPVTDETARRALFDWSAGRVAGDEVPALVAAFERAQSADTVQAWRAAVADGLSWEMLPDAALSHAEVWEDLVDRGLPMTALLRQLPRLTRLGVTRTRRSAILAQLTDGARLQAARVHPVSVLVAARTYASGHSARGESSWTPDGAILDGLDAAFYQSFGTVQPSGQRTLLALDVSGSMTAPVSNLPLTCREAAAAMALVTASTERDYDVVAFTARSGGDWFSGTVLQELAISPRQRLDDVLRVTDGLPFGRTDCSLPMLWALEQGRRYDLFAVYTDNETYAGQMQPHQALDQYRQRTGIPAKLVVVGMTATRFSIADPADPGSLDVVGFDSAVPQLIADFARGL